MNALLTILLVLLIAWAGWRTVQKMQNGGGCCGEHAAAEKKAAVADRNRSHYPYKVSLQIGGMTCENCARKVENALNRLAVTWAKVSIATCSAEVLCKSEPDEAVLRATVREAGYVVTEYRN